MPVLFDFGISQEDPLTEQLVLGIQPKDRILSVASGGEVPLSLLCMNENIQIKAVDISQQQIMLCQLKLLAAIHIDYPLNGHFLGYALLEGPKRKQLYFENIRPYLLKEEVLFWDFNLSFIERGIVSAGRFEQYLRKMRFVANLVIGKKNIQQLVACQTIEEQENIFQNYIASRKNLQLLFKIAFHPAIYKKRGLQEQALIHAGKTTGDQFYSKFQNYCVSGLAANNYLLQCFLTGNCITEKSFPCYLLPENKNCLMNNLNDFELVEISLQDALCENEKGYYNKIHLSNMGDWLSEKQFSELLVLLKSNCNAGTKICYRYLQKNHFSGNEIPEFVIDKAMSEKAESKDRFPFYNILSITLQSASNS